MSNTSYQPKALLSWSSGKDSAWALHIVQQEDKFNVVGLLTSINETHDRVAMHAVRSQLLRQQARAVGLPLREVLIPSPCTNAQYQERMSREVERAVAEGITHIVFGDLFLEDIRAYREKQLEGTGITPLFPLWKIPTDTLARRMVQGGLVAHLTAVDPKQCSPELVGKKYDLDFINSLPPSVDPCGENGEFHTFVSEGPMFKMPVPIRVGEKVERGGFHFCDLLPADQPEQSQTSTADSRDTGSK